MRVDGYPTSLNGTRIALISAVGLGDTMLGPPSRRARPAPRITRHSPRRPSVATLRAAMHAPSAWTRSDRFGACRLQALFYSAHGASVPRVAQVVASLTLFCGATMKEGTIELEGT